MLKTFAVHSKWRNIVRRWKSILTALWLLSSYIAYAYSIPHIIRPVGHFLQKKHFPFHFLPTGLHYDLIRGRIETASHFEVRRLAPLGIVLLYIPNPTL